MTAPFTLRPYQAEAVDALLSASGESRLCCAPVGAGKTAMIAELSRRLLTSSAGRVLVLTHAGELVDQNAAAIRRQCPKVRVDVLAGKTRTAGVSASVLVANIASAHRAVDRIIAAGRVASVIVDEAHRINPAGAVYADTLAALREAGQIRLFGFTGSPWREGWGHLCDPGPDGAAQIFETLAYEIEHRALVEAGFILPVRARSTAERFNLAGVRSKCGDFAPGELEARVNRDETNRAAVAELVEFGRRTGRKRWLLFATTIDHAERLTAELLRHGIAAGCVNANQSEGERAKTVEAYRRGDLTALVNVAALTTGFDVPETDLIGLLRPTKSRVLYYQMLGRGTRLAPGKADCVVLDFGGSTLRIGSLNAIDWRAPVATAPHCEAAWECRDCQTFNALARTTCEACGVPQRVQKRPRVDRERNLSARDMARMAEGSRIANVLDWSFRPFPTEDGTMNLRITVKLDDGGPVATGALWFSRKYPSWHATLSRLWSTLGGALPAPYTAQQALDRVGELTRPTAVLAVPRPSNGTTYFNVSDWIMPKVAQNAASVSQRWEATHAA